MIHNTINQLEATSLDKKIKVKSLQNIREISTNDITLEKNIPRLHSSPADIFALEIKDDFDINSIDEKNMNSIFEDNPIALENIIKEESSELKIENAPKEVVIIDNVSESTTQETPIIVPEGKRLETFKQIICLIANLLQIFGMIYGCVTFAGDGSEGISALEIFSFVIGCVLSVENFWNVVEILKKPFISSQK